MKASAYALGAVIVALVGAEAVLQVAALFVSDRGAAWRPDATVRTLCIGDSHTFGGGLPSDESYPSQLQAMLEAAEPGLHSVVNLGIPGLNTRQLRNRASPWLARYEPGILVVWAGVNDAWNRAEVEEGTAGALATLDRILLRSRLYRLARVRAHDRQLDEAAAGMLDDPAGPEGGRMQHTRQADGEIVRNIGQTGAGPSIPPHGREDIGYIAEAAARIDTRVVLITYPVALAWFVPANRALCQVARDYDLPLVDSSAALARVPWSERKWLWAMHPGTRIYREIAADVTAIIRDPSRGFVTEEQPLECLEIPDADFGLALGLLQQFVRQSGPPAQASFEVLVAQVRDSYGANVDLDTLQPASTTELVAADIHPRLRAAVVEWLVGLSEAGGPPSPEQEQFIEEVAAAIFHSTM